MASSLDKVLATVGPRLRALRQQRDLTLADLSAATGISASTLSRLESGQRRPNLELLLPLAQAYRVPLDELIGAPASGDPRIHAQPFTRNGMTVLPLTVRTRTFFVTVTTFGTWTFSGPGSVAFARVVTVTPDEGVTRPVTAPVATPTPTATNAMIRMRRPMAAALHRQQRNEQFWRRTSPSGRIERRRMR